MGDADKKNKFQDPDLISLKYGSNDYLFDSPDFSEISFFEKIILAFKMLKKNFFILSLMYSLCIFFSIISLLLAMFPLLIGFSSIILQIIDSDNEDSPTLAELFPPFSERFFQLFLTGLFFLAIFFAIALFSNFLTLKAGTMFDAATYNPDVNFLLQKMNSDFAKELPTHSMISILFILFLSFFIKVFYILIINIVYFYSVESYATAIETIQVAFGILFNGIFKWLEALAITLVIIALYYSVLAGLFLIFADYLTYFTESKTFMAFLIKIFFSLIFMMPPIIFSFFIFGITYRQVTELD